MANITLKPITAEEVLAQEAQGSPREIIHGKWADKTEMAGKRHGAIGTNLIAILHPFVKKNRLGKVYQDNTTYVLEGTPENIITMRIPDVSFVSAARVDATDPGFYYLAPDLAIEIVSPSETKPETASKVADYLQFGTQQVWVVYPDEQRVVIHFPDGTQKTYSVEDTLSAGNLLPGLQFNIAEIFDLA